MFARKSWRRAASCNGRGLSARSSRAEAWLTFKEWVERCNPRLAYNVARNIYTGSQIPEAERHWAELVRREARGRMRIYCRQARSYACRRPRFRHRNAASHYRSRVQSATASCACAPMVG